MCNPAALAVVSIVATVAGTAIQIQGQRAQGKAAKASAEYKAAVDRNNKIIADRQAEDARRRGEAAVARKQLETRQLIGRQRAALAGAGQVVDVGSALDITSDTDAIGKLDALTIMTNAEREALGYEVQGMNFESSAALNVASGENALRASRTAQLATFTSGIASVSSKWYNFNKAGVFDGGGSNTSIRAENLISEDFY